MYPKIFEMVKDDLDVQSKLGTNPLRFFPFSYATQYTDKKLAYAVWQLVSGTPSNTLSCRPDSDNFSVQVDVYSESIQEVRETAKALIRALETKAFIMNLRGESSDFETKRFRYSFDVNIIQKRDP